MNELTILHISDLHIKEGDSYARDTVLKALIDSVAYFKEQGRKPDLIAVTGDITYSGKEYGERTTKFCDDLLEAADLGKNKERLFIVPGNHDADKDTGEWLRRTLSSETESVKYFEPNSPGDHFNKFKAFNLWYNEYFKGIRSIEPKTTCQLPEVITINDLTIGVLLINSALFSFPDEKDEHQLWIGRRCLGATVDNLKERDIDLRIAMMHHPPGWLSDVEQANIKAALKDNCDILMHGHLHLQDAESIAGHKGVILQVAAGACYQTREYPNKAIFLRIDYQSNKAYLLPIHYVDSPRSVWTVDTGLYPDQPDYEGVFDLRTKKPVAEKLPDSKPKKTMAKIKPNEPAVDPAALRRAYLNRLFETTSQVSLSGIDPNIPEDAKSRLQLSAVYTALLTLTPEQEQAELKIEAPDRERKLLPALEQLERHHRLVLMGDPGSGKSTFVNFVAVCLAGESLSNPTVNLKTLQVPLPDDEGNEGKTAQSWKHGALLPVRIILRDFAARGLPAQGQPGCAKHLWDFITRDLEESGIEAWAGHLKKELLEQGGLLLLDGLDEVPEADYRREQIKQAVRDFAATYQKCRILVTSRTYAYQKQDWKLPGFTEAMLAPFSRGQIRQFVDRWYAHTAELRGTNREDAQGRAVLLKRTIFASERLRVLAERPLLLTLMASLHAWRGGELPEKREQLYADATELLLETWQKAKTVWDKEGKVLVAQPSLIEWLKVDREKMRDLLNRLAFEAHGKQPDLTGTADIAETDLVNGMIGLQPGNPDVKPVQLIDYLSWRAGLLIPRGNGVYTFPHRTFQEYLAACYLVKKEYPRLLAGLIRREPNRWREVALLAGAKVAGTPFALWGLVEVLLNNPAPEEDALAGDWGALVAGQLIAESANLSDLSPVDQTKLEQVRKRQMQIMEQGRLPAVERAEAGKVLGRIGDPRKALITLDEMEFCLVPAGEFWLGDDSPSKYDLDYDYWIGRFPVTVSQFQAFVRDSGYKPMDEDSLKDPPNCPVRWVNWHEASKFCTWLTEAWQVKKLVPENWKIRLPSEVEWEKAAQGGILVPEQPIIGKLPLINRAPKLQNNLRPRRKYPWGDEIDTNRANYGETGIGDISAVGCFPTGASPYGVLELSGNLWEWTGSIYKEYPYDPKDGREAYDSGALRVLRGGSWFIQAELLRSSNRVRRYPGGRFDFIGFRVVSVARTKK